MNMTDPEEWLYGKGEMAARIRAHPWEATPLGPIGNWPQGLRTAVSIVLGSSQAMQLAWGPERTILYNDAYAPMLGDRHPAALGLSFRDAWPDIWTEIEPLVARVDAGETVRFEDLPLVMTRNGYPEETWWNFSYSPLRDETGSVAGLLNVTVDATAVVRAQHAAAALRDSHMRHRLLVESFAQATWETDGAGVVVEDSPSWRAYTGQTLEEWLGYGWLDAIHPDDRAYAERQWREAVTALALVNAEFRLASPDGGWRWTNVRAAPVVDASGNIEKWLGLNIDIDDRKQTEAALLESEERYRALFDSMDEAYAVVEVLQDESGRWNDFLFLQANPAFLTHTGMPYPVGHTATDLLGTPNPSWAEVYGRVAETGEPERWEEGEPTLGRVFDLNAFRLGGPGSRRVAVLFTDVTERKRAEAALRESEERQAFLLRLSDALRPLSDADEIQRIAARLAAEHWEMAGANYVRIETRDGVPYAIVRQSYVAEGREPINGDYPLADFPGFSDRMTSGEAMMVTDVASDPTLPDLDKANWKAMDLATLLSVSLVKGGRLVACFAVHGPQPKTWTTADAQLLEEIAERTWAAVERTGAEAALRESEARFRLLFETMDEGFCLCERVPGEPIDFRYVAVNPAFDRQSGLDHPVGKTIREIVPNVEESIMQAYARVEETDRAEHFVTRVGALDQWFEVEAIPADGPGRVAMLFRNVTERKRAETALRESEERQAFLLKLSDALRPVRDPVAVQEVTTRLLGENLQVDRSYYAEFDWPGDVLHIHHEYTRTGAVSAIGSHPISAFQDLLQFSHEGRPLVCDNVAEHPLFKSEVAAYRARGTDGFILVPLVKQDVMVACLCVTMETPRAWTQSEVELVQEVAERTWAAVERARAETALRDSEERLQMLMQGIPQLVWRAVDEGHWTWASPQWTDFTGQPGEASHDRGWLETVHPDDRDRVLKVWTGAVERGEFHADYRLCHARENRYRWFQTRATPVRDGHGMIVEWLGTSTDVDDLRQLQERQGILVAELQHRTRNLITVVSAVSQQTLTEVSSLLDFKDRFGDRLAALSRVQGLLSHLSAGERVTFRSLLDSELKALGAPADKLTLEGPEDVPLRSSTVQTFSLALHELATNALKYGALSTPDGHLAVRWHLVPAAGVTPRLHVDWCETGVDMTQVADRPRGGGYGRELIEHALPYQLDADTTYEMAEQGVHCTINVPIAGARA